MWGDNMKSLGATSYPYNLHNHIPNTSLEIGIMDIRMSKHMKALLLKSMARSDSYELFAKVIHQWFDEIDYEEHEDYDVKDWPKYKIVKDTMRFYFHVGNAFGVDLVTGFIKVLNKEMEWTDVSFYYPFDYLDTNDKTTYNYATANSDYGYYFERWLNER